MIPKAAIKVATKPDPNKLKGKFGGIKFQIKKRVLSNPLVGYSDEESTPNEEDESKDQCGENKHVKECDDEPPPPPATHTTEQHTQSSRATKPHTGWNSNSSSSRNNSHDSTMHKDSVDKHHRTENTVSTKARSVSPTKPKKADKEPQPSTGSDSSSSSESSSGSDNTSDSDSGSSDSDSDSELAVESIQSPNDQNDEAGSGAGRRLGLKEHGVMSPQISPDSPSPIKECQELPTQDTPEHVIPHISVTMPTSQSHESFGPPVSEHREHHAQAVEHYRDSSVLDNQSHVSRNDRSYDAQHRGHSREMDERNRMRDHGSSRDYERGVPRDHERVLSRDHERGVPRDHDRGSSRDGDRGERRRRPRESESDDYHRHREPERERHQTSERHRRHSPEYRRERERHERYERDRRRHHRSPERRRSRTPDRSHAHLSEHAKRRSAEQHRSRSPDRRRSRTPDRRGSRTPDKRRSRSPEYSRYPRETHQHERGWRRRSPSPVRDRDRDRYRYRDDGRRERHSRDDSRDKRRRQSENYELDAIPLPGNIAPPAVTSHQPVHADHLAAYEHEVVTIPTIPLQPSVDHRHHVQPEAHPPYPPVIAPLVNTHSDRSDMDMDMDDSDADQGAPIEVIQGPGSHVMPGTPHSAHSSLDQQLNASTTPIRISLKTSTKFNLKKVDKSSHVFEDEDSSDKPSMRSSAPWREEQVGPVEDHPKPTEALYTNEPQPIAVLGGSLPKEEKSVFGKIGPVRTHSQIRHVSPPRVTRFHTLETVAKTDSSVIESHAEEGGAAQKIDVFGADVPNETIGKESESVTRLYSPSQEAASPYLTISTIGTPDSHPISVLGSSQYSSPAPEERPIQVVSHARTSSWSDDSPVRPRIIEEFHKHNQPIIEDQPPPPPAVAPTPPESPTSQPLKKRKRPSRFSDILPSPTAQERAPNLMTHLEEPSVISHPSHAFSQSIPPVTNTTSSWPVTDVPPPPPATANFVEPVDSNLPANRARPVQASNSLSLLDKVTLPSVLQGMIDGVKKTSNDETSCEQLKIGQAETEPKTEPQVMTYEEFLKEQTRTLSAIGGLDSEDSNNTVDKSNSSSYSSSEPRTEFGHIGEEEDSRSGSDRVGDRDQDQADRTEDGKKGNRKKRQSQRGDSTDCDGDSNSRRRSSRIKTMDEKKRKEIEDLERKERVEKLLREKEEEKLRPLVTDVHGGDSEKKRRGRPPKDKGDLPKSDLPVFTPPTQSSGLDFKPSTGMSPVSSTKSEFSSPESKDFVSPRPGKLKARWARWSEMESTLTADTNEGGMADSSFSPAAQVHADKDESNIDLHHLADQIKDASYVEVIKGSSGESECHGKAEPKEPDPDDEDIQPPEFDKVSENIHYSERCVSNLLYNNSTHKVYL